MHHLFAPINILLMDDVQLQNNIKLSFENCLTLSIAYIPLPNDSHTHSIVEILVHVTKVSEGRVR